MAGVNKDADEISQALEGRPIGQNVRSDGLTTFPATRERRIIIENSISLSNKKESEKKCVSCFFSVDLENEGHLSCLSGHVLCAECGRVFVDSILGSGHVGCGTLPVSAAIPPKCCICRCEVPALAFERMLNPAQRLTYLSLVAMSTLKKGEKIVSCVDCNYYEIRSDDPPIFFCQKCGSAHCTVCKTRLPMLTEKDLFEDYEKNDAEGKQSKMEHHLRRCSVLSKEKEKFDNAIFEGSGVQCPTCGVVGRKDCMCCHMTCERCSTTWCYICGLSEEKCDKATRKGKVPSNPIYGHNVNWETNPKRCPMYLSQIAEVDEEWEDLFEEVVNSDGEYEEDELEERCLNKLHRWRTLKKLHALRIDIGAEKWKKMWNTFPSVRSCGFTNEEIASPAAGGAPLFTRSPV